MVPKRRIEMATLCFEIHSLGVDDEQIASNGGSNLPLQNDMLGIGNGSFW